MYRQGRSEESAKYNFSYIPHVVLADEAGNQVHAFDSGALMEAQKAGNLAATVTGRAIGGRAGR